MKYSKIITNKILECLKSGLTAKDACYFVGISEETYYKWKREKPEFSESIERELLEFKQVCLKSIMDSKDWKAHAWWLERRYPAEYSARHIIVNNINNRERTELSEEEEREIDEYLCHYRREIEAEKLKTYS